MVSPESVEGFMEDEEISLGEILAAGRRRLAQRKAQAKKRKWRLL
jgi:hypothetical protein